MFLFWSDCLCHSQPNNSTPSWHSQTQYCICLGLPKVPCSSCSIVTRSEVLFAESSPLFLSPCRSLWTRQATMHILCLVCSRTITHCAPITGRRLASCEAAGDVQLWPDPMRVIRPYSTAKSLNSTTWMQLVMDELCIHATAWYSPFSKSVSPSCTCI